MNGRIRELAELADIVFRENGDAYTRGRVDESIEKLAELIVRECANRCRELGNPELGQGIKKHFGVE